jgi:hypothetical protein
MDYRQNFITEVVSGKSFLEVGGLWGAVNEKATVAFQAGASEIAALDIWESGSEWWEKFRERCEALGLNKVAEHIGSIDNVEFIRNIGQYDVVHCSGVLYHCPNPFLTLRNLHFVSRDFVILTSAVMPPSISNELGQINFDDDSAVLVPAIVDSKRRIVDKYIIQRYGGGAYGVNSPVDAWFFDGGAPNYGPWWWLWSAGYLRSMALCAGFALVKEGSQFDGTGHCLLLKKIPDTVQNFGVY